MAFTLGNDLFTAIDTGIDGLFTTGLANFTTLIAPLIGAFVSLYGVFMALNWLWTGGTPNLAGELIKRMCYLSIISAFAFNATHYKTAIVDPANKIGSEISAAFSPTGADVPNVIDQMANQVIDTIGKIWDATPDMSITDLNIGPLLQGLATILVVGAGGVFFIVVAAIQLAINKILLAGTLLLGPLFIWAAFFPSVREYFGRWVAQVLNYVLAFALFGLTFTLLTNLLQTYVSGTGFTNVLVGGQTILKVIFTYLLFAGVLVSVPALTQSLVGGLSANGAGAVGQAAGATGRGLGRLLSKVPRPGGGRGPNQIGPAGDRIPRGRIPQSPNRRLG